MNNPLEPSAPPSSKRPQPRRRGKLSLVIFLAVLLGFLALNITMMLPYLLAILMGGILSLLFRKPYLYLRNHGFSPKIASSIVTLGIFVLVIGPVTLFGVAAVKQGIALGQTIGESPEMSFDRIVKRVTEWGPVQAFAPDPGAIQARLRESVATGAQAISGIILKFAGSVPEFLLQAVLAMLACFFFLIDASKFMGWLQEKIPMDSDVRFKLYFSFRDTAVSVIIATIAAAGAQAAIMVAAYLLLGVPAAFLAGGATFILAWIPMIGSTPVWVIGAAVLYSQGSIVKALAMIGFGVVVSLIDNVIRAGILKGRNEIHPLVSLVAIFGGIHMFGLVGVFIGPILTAVLLSLLQVWPTVAKRFGLLDSQDGSAVPATQLVNPGLTRAAAAGIVVEESIDRADDRK